MTFPGSGVKEMVAFTGGMLVAETGFRILGAVPLAEELYETGVVALIIRFGARADPTNVLRVIFGGNP